MPFCNNLRSYCPRIHGCHAHSEVKREYSQCLNSFSMKPLGLAEIWLKEQTVAGRQLRWWGWPAVLLTLLWKGATSKTGPQSITGGGDSLGHHGEVRWTSFLSISSLWQVGGYTHKAAPRSAGWADQPEGWAHLNYFACAQVIRRAPVPQPTHGNLCTRFAFQRAMHILLVEIIHLRSTYWSEVKFLRPSGQQNKT